MNIRDIMGQATGHYVGKIANGKPPYVSAQFDLDQAYSKEIPFSLLVATGDDKKDQQVMNAIVEANYNRIINDVKQLLEPYKNIK